MEEIKENPIPLPNGRKKLPYDFWREIGSPRFVVAPMVDNSDLAFRMQTRRYGAELTFTQMLNSNMFVQSKECRANLFEVCPEDRPLFTQIAGHDPQTMLAAAKLVEDHCDAVDINLGCPQSIAKRGRYGAFLMEELELLDQIVRTMVNGLKIPVTCKTRIYKDDFETSIRLCETLVNAGASVLTIHGRTRDEKGCFVGACDWDMIRRIKEHFAKKEIPIPIIANGGIENLDDVLRCLEYTKADAVMTSEAILENPAIFSRSIDRNGIFRSQLELAEEYLELCDVYPVYHIKCVRSHILKMVYRYLDGDVELRNIFANSNTLADFRNACQYLRNKLESKDQAEREAEEKQLVSWYNRHRLSNKVVEGDDDGENYASANVSTKSTGPRPPFSALDESVLEDAFSMFQCY